MDALGMRMCMCDCRVTEPEVISYLLSWAEGGRNSNVHRSTARMQRCRPRA